MTVIPLHRVKQNGKVDLWDRGPQVPPAPKAPKDPDASLKGAEFAAAELAYEDDIIRYKAELRRWTEDRVLHREWKDTNGGPVKIELWGVDARHALATEPQRFALDLKPGENPGRAQREADEREKEEIEELKRAAALDPQFGGKLEARA